MHVRTQNRAYVGDKCTLADSGGVSFELRQRRVILRYCPGRTLNPHHGLQKSGIHGQSVEYDIPTLHRLRLPRGTRPKVDTNKAPATPVTTCDIEYHHSPRGIMSTSSSLLTLWNRTRGCLSAGHTHPAIRFHSRYHSVLTANISIRYSRHDK